MPNSPAINNDRAAVILIASRGASPRQDRASDLIGFAAIDPTPPTTTAPVDAGGLPVELWGIGHSETPAKDPACVPGIFLQPIPLLGDEFVKKIKLRIRKTSPDSFGFTVFHFL
jgi:hypothetical protein